MSRYPYRVPAAGLVLWLAVAALGCTAPTQAPRSPSEGNTTDGAPSATGTQAALAPFPPPPTLGAEPVLDPGSLMPSPTTTQQPTPPDGLQQLSNPIVGYTLLIPEGWQVRGQVLATEFAAGAACESVEIADSPSPPDSGSAAGVLHAFVQVCARPLDDNLTLEGFMRQTYGEGFSAQFQSYELGGAPAYRALNVHQDATFFLQANGYRLQITTAVAADAGTEPERRAQIQAILESFSLFQP